MTEKKKRTIIVIILFISSILFLLIYKRINIIYHIGIPCIFHRITKLYCPGCGMTRAIFALLNLNIKQAIRNNILVVLVMPFIVIYIINYAYIWINNLKKDPSKIFPKWLWYTLLIITISFGIIRNIKYFYWLNPI